MIFQLIAGLVMAGLLTAGFLSWKADIRAEGEARVVKEYEAQKLAAAQENERIAAEGKAAVLRLLAEKEKQNRVQAAKLANLQAQRQGESDARAREDARYSVWRDEPVPAAVSDRLRNRVESTTATASGRSVSGGASLSPGTPVSTAAESAEQSWLGNLYRRITGRTGAGVEGR